MINTKKVIRMARKWQKKAAIGRQRITSSRTINMIVARTERPSGGIDKGYVVICTTDKRRFVIPLAYLSNSMFLQQLNMSKEEFGLSSDGPILLPCDSVLKNYIFLLIQRSLAKVLEKAVLNSLNTYRCSSYTTTTTTTFFHKGHADQQSLVCGF